MTEQEKFEMMRKHILGFDHKWYGEPKSGDLFTIIFEHDWIHIEENRRHDEHRETREHHVMVPHPED